MTRAPADFWGTVPAIIHMANSGIKAAVMSKTLLSSRCQNITGTFSTIACEKISGAPANSRVDPVAASDRRNLSKYGTVSPTMGCGRLFVKTKAYGVDFSGPSRKPANEGWIAGIEQVYRYVRIIDRHDRQAHLWFLSCSNPLRRS